MNPLPITLSMVRKSPWMTLAFAALIAFATALGVAITAQEKALKSGSARAADRFEIVIAAPGSQTDALFKTVFLRPGSLELLSPDVVAEILASPGAAFASPLGFGDSFEGNAVAGATRDLVLALSGGALAQGRLFESWEEAIVGSASPLQLGAKFKTEHGHEEEGAEGPDGAHEHDSELTVTGRMAPTGSPWDRAVILPIEKMWRLHNLPSGHDPAAGEKLGPPFDAQFLAPVPAVIVKARTVAEAYALRSRFRAERSTAFFPAEALLELYGLMGDIRALMSALALGAQILVIASVLAAIMILLRLERRQLALLRALGAPRLYVLSAVWLYAAFIIVTGAAAGLGLGWLSAFAVSHYVEAAAGVTLQPRLGWPELRLVFSVAAAGLVLAAFPAFAIYRAPVADALRRE